MDPKRLSYLLEQYRLNRCTREERAEIDSWYAGLDNPDYKPRYQEGTAEAKEYVAQHTARIMDVIARRRKRSIVLRRTRIAASIVGLLGLAMMSLYIYKNSFSHVKQPPAVVHYEVTNSQVADSRYLNLPDNSVVILHAGSRLKVDTTSFNKEGRHVTLTGEAYFDIAHNPAQPFVIKVNDLTVTVLGTAFNIKQVGDSVSVTVTRGKVQVERDSKLLGMLTQGQQIATSNAAPTTQVRTAALEPVTAWMQEGLHFNNTTLGDAVARLRERYDANIILKSPGLEHCVVSLATPLSGTESLTDVLDVLCTVLGATYTSNQGKIEITGQACKE